MFVFAAAILVIIAPPTPQATLENRRFASAAKPVAGIDRLIRIRARVRVPRTALVAELLADVTCPFHVIPPIVPAESAPLAVLVDLDAALRVGRQADIPLLEGGPTLVS